MNRRTFLKTVAVGATGMALPRRRTGAAEKRRRPNVLLIMSDDQGYGDIRSHGNDKIDTPVLDKLAASGARFDRFYVCPLCAPTRAALLAGRYPLRTGTAWVTRGLETMRSNEVTIAEVFRQAGYATGCFGKWHNGAHYPHHPTGQGFDEFLGFCAGHWNNYFDTTLERNGRPIKTKGFITDVLTDAAIRFIEAHRDRPLFCYVPYNAPHGPFQVPDRYFDKYTARGLDTRTACIYGMVENVDENVGRLLKKLDELGLAGDTIVIFLTDNGPNGRRYNAGMRGAKGSIDEGGVRVPMFVRWPGRIRPGTKVEQIAAHIDVLPTLVELCGLPAPKTLPLDGASLAPLLRGEARNWPDRMIFHARSRARGKGMPPGAVRTQRWRLVGSGKGYALYDMQADPGQAKNVAARHPEVVRKLQAACESWYKDVTRTPIERLPILVGYAEANVVELPAPECYMAGGVAYKGGRGWANDWIARWRSTDDEVWWDIDVVREGRFGVTLLYCCPAADVGAKVRVRAGDRSVEGIVAAAHDPKPIPSPDRVKRGEVYEKVWAPLRLGTLTLGKGRTKLSVQALTKPGREVFELKAVRLERK